MQNNKFTTKLRCITHKRGLLKIIQHEEEDARHMRTYLIL